jgi:hypothetical protein
MQNTLIERLTELTDKRRDQGKRHEQITTILIAIMSIMSGYLSYEAMADFAKRNKKDLIKYLGIIKKIVPSKSTIWRITTGIGFEELTEMFRRWVLDFLNIEKEEIIGIDGKGIASTVKNALDSKQEFEKIVSAFLPQKGMTIDQIKINNSDKGGEIGAVQDILKILETLGIKDAIIALDALHCQKKQLKQLPKVKIST